MQICQNCGKQNTDSARFCKKCGNSLVMQAQQRRASGSNQNRKPAQQQSRQQSRKPAQQQNRSAAQRSGRSRKSRRENSNTGLTVVMCLVGALVAVLIIGAAIMVAMHVAG